MWGDTVSEIAEANNLTVPQLQALNPQLREDPDVLWAGDQLSLLTPEGFGTVAGSVLTTGDAAAAQAAYERMTTGQGQLPEHLRRLNRANAPAVDQGAEQMEQQAVDLLVPGFLDAGLPAALDEAAMTQALDDHAAAIMPIGDGQQGFSDVVDRARREAQRLIDDVFGRQVTFTDSAGNPRTATLRDLVADAEGTPQASRMQDASPQWQDAQAGMTALLDSLGQERVDAGGAEAGPEAAVRTNAAQYGAQILWAASPNGHMDPAVDPYLAAVRGAADEVMIQRPLRAVNDAANNGDLPTAISANTVPALTEMLRQTEGLPPDLAAQRIAAASGILGKEISEVFAAALEHQNGAFATEAKVHDLLNSLGILADRVYGSEGGAELIRDLARPLTTAIGEAAGFEELGDFSILDQVADGVREAVGNGASPLFAREIARQLMDPGIAGPEGVHPEAASTILSHAAMGIDDLRTNLETAGNEFYERILLPAALGQQNLGGAGGPRAHVNGVQALLDENQPLVERANRLAEGTVFSLAGHSQGLPPELQGLDGARDLQDSLGALDRLVAQDPATGAGQEIRPVPLMMQSSEGAITAGLRVEREQALQHLRNIPPENLDRLIGELGKLPEDDPLAPLAARMTGLQDPKAVLYANPELTFALLDRFGGSEALPDVTPAPNLGFISRALKDVVAEAFAFQRPSGGGLIPGTRPLMPHPGFSPYAWGLGYQPIHSPLKNAAVRIFAGKQGLSWRTGIPSRVQAIPFFNSVSAGLNAWGAWTLLQSDSMLDKAWGSFFATGAAMDVFRVGDAARAWATGKPGFSEVSGLRRWETATRLFNGTGLVLTTIQTVKEYVEGDWPMGVAWTPAAVASGYAALPRVPLRGPALAGGFLVTSIATTLISQHRHVQDANKLEGPIGTYLEAALPGVDKPESLANSDENGNPYLALNAALAEAQGITPERMVRYLYSLPREERDRLIDHALQVKPDENGVYPVESDGEREVDPSAFTGHLDWRTGTRIGQDGTIYDGAGRPPPEAPLERRDIESIEDFQRWARENGYVLPVV